MIGLSDWLIIDSDIYADVDGIFMYFRNFLILSWPIDWICDGYLLNIQCARRRRDNMYDGIIWLANPRASPRGKYKQQHKVNN